MNRPHRTFEDLRREARATAPLRVSRRELAQVKLLKRAHQESIVPLLRECPVKLLARGEVLLRAGDACPALYLVLSGSLRLEVPSENAPASPVPAGDCVGELSLLDRTMLATTISAVEPTRLLVIDRRAAWDLIRASHEIAQNWLSLIAERTHISAVIDGSEVLKTCHERNTTHDERTGLNNRRWLDTMLPRQIARSAESDAPLGLLFIEIDDFADYRIRCGPDAGDQACRVVAEALVKNVRPTDLIACWSTSRFVIVLPEAQMQHACSIGERIRHAVSRAGAFTPGEGALPRFTVSVGAAQLPSAGDASTLLAAAEAALQTAKAAGGDRVGMRE